MPANVIKDNSVADPAPSTPRPVKIKLRKDLLVEKTNHAIGDVVEVDKNRAKYLVENKAAYRVSATGEVLPYIDQDGNPLPFDEDDDGDDD